MTANAKTAALEALIEAHATELKLPTVKRRFRALAQEATREQQAPIAYLAALLEAEHQERAERAKHHAARRTAFPHASVASTQQVPAGFVQQQQILALAAVRAADESKLALPRGDARQRNANRVDPGGFFAHERA